MSSEVISLENFDPNKKSNRYIDSPRSVEVCRKQEIDPVEVFYISLNEYKKIMKSEHLHKEYLILRWKEYEKRRKEKLQLLLEKRQKLINN